MSKVLVISSDTIPIGEELAAGPGIRAWEIARGLQGYGHSVTLAMPGDLFKNQKADGLKIIPWELFNLGNICMDSDCVVVPQGRGDLAKAYVETVSGDIPTVVDVYDPVLIEFLSMRSPEEASIELGQAVPLFKRGDFFICANERQRYYYLGILNVLGRINPLTFDQKILDLVPFGVPNEAPVHTKNVLRGKLVGPDDLVILWFSGIYPWFDAATLIKAMPDIIKEVPDAKLVIMGGVHPRLHAPADEYEKAKKSAKAAGLLNKNIFFAEWKPYPERANWYLESDLAVCTYKNTLETLLSHRTRVIDLLWGGLPLIVSQGDEVSEMVTSHQCGVSVRTGDTKMLTGAIVSLLKDKSKRETMASNARRLVEEKLTWDKVLKPLDEFCQSPSLAADRMEEQAYQSIAIQDKDDQIRSLEEEIKSIKESMGWQLLTRYRQFLERLLPSTTRRRRIYNLAQKGLKATADGWTGSWSKLRYKLKPRRNSYVLEDEPKPQDIKEYKEECLSFKYKPKISIITPVWDPEENWLRLAIKSVVNQAYDNWELCLADGGSTKPYVREILEEYAQKDPRIKVKFLGENKGIAGNSNEALSLATGEFIGLLDHDDELAFFALSEAVKALNKNPALDLIYSDEDKIDEWGNRKSPFFKPDWSPEMLLSTNYICHFAVIRRDLIDKVGGFQPETSGAQDWDLFLRVTEKTQKIHHIPKILYHWRESSASCAQSAYAKPYVFKAQRLALSNHLRQRNLPAELTFSASTNLWRLKWRNNNEAKVSIIILTKDNVRLLRSCVESILNKTSHQNFEIIVVDTGSKEAEVSQYYQELSENPNVQVVKDDRPFNFSAANNQAVRYATGEVVLFLNDDIEVIAPDWLEEMVGWVEQKEIGIVGAKLLKADQTIQHAGVILGLQGFAGHLFAGAHDSYGGIFGRADWYRNYLAVTGACMMMRRKVFEEVGGFDEAFVLCGSDVELCLRVYKSGYRVVYTPFAKLIHHESATRGTHIPSQDFRVAYQHYEPFLRKGDPYYNANLSQWHPIPRVKKHKEKDALRFAEEKIGD